MWVVIIVWFDGEKETIKAMNEDQANEIANNYHMAFGNQIAYIGIDKR